MRLNIPKRKRVRDNLLRLDHFVVHIDQDPQKMMFIQEWMDENGIPFDSERGLNTKEYKIANLWIGDQYIELSFLKKNNANGWKKEWVDQYNLGKRGIFGICLYTDSLDEIKEGLINREVMFEGPERVTFKRLWGLKKKSLPYRTIYTKPIPNSDLQIMFMQMDSQEKLKFTRKHFMHPNTEEVGIVSIEEAIIIKDFSIEEWCFIENVFPNLQGNYQKKTLDMGKTKLHFIQDPLHELSVELKAKSENHLYENIEFEIENVRLVIG